MIYTSLPNENYRLKRVATLFMNFVQKPSFNLLL